MQFQELTDKQWGMISQHVPKPAKTGRPRDDGRRTISGIIYVLISGCRWSGMPTKYGDDSAADRRPDSWQQKGVWKRIPSGLIRTAHRQGKTSLQKRISVDSSTIPAKKGAT